MHTCLHVNLPENVIICRYQQYVSGSGKNLPDRECMVQQDYEVDIEDAYEPDKVTETK